MYAAYENTNNLKLTTMAYVGMNDSELTRHDELESHSSDVNDIYFGLDNSVSKRFDLNIAKLYVTPKAELNMMYLMQDDVSEDNNGMKISGEDSFSVEAGIGATLGRDFLVGDKGTKINLEGSIMAYAELADPYQDSTVENLDASLNAYLGNDFYGEFSVRATLETAKDLGIYTGVDYIAGDEDEGWDVNVGLNYKF
jgi:outer membrane autotransporter protein